MGRRVNKLYDMVIDEVSLVDNDANGHARHVIAKRDEQPEEQMTQPVDEKELTFSEEDLVFDDEGNAYLPVNFGERGDETEQAEQTEQTEEPEEEETDEDAGTQAAEAVLTKLSKALGDDDRDKAVAGAYGEIAKLTKRAQRAEAVAKQERDLRLTREYVSKAAEYRTPVPPEVLGPVLKRCAESLSKADCQVLAQCLEAASQPVEFDPYAEIGKAGGGSNGNILDEVNAAAEELFVKGVEAGTGFTREQSIAKVFDMNPAAYDQYLADNPQFRR
jgi:hypothetical protein